MNEEVEFMLHNLCCNECSAHTWSVLWDLVCGSVSETETWDLQEAWDLEKTMSLSLAVGLYILGDLQLETEEVDWGNFCCAETRIRHFMAVRKLTRSATLWPPKDWLHYPVCWMSCFFNWAFFRGIMSSMKCEFVCVKTSFSCMKSWGTLDTLWAGDAAVCRVIFISLEYSPVGDWQGTVKDA